MRRTALNIIIATWCIGTGLWTGAFAQAPDSSPSLTMGADVVVLPIVNYSEKAEAHELLLPRLYAELERAEVSFVTSEEIRPLLRKHRIRVRGWVGKKGALTIKAATDARLAMLGSWDVVRKDLDAEIGFSLRLIDLETMRLVASVSDGAAGSDYTGMLGLGRVSDLGELADRVIKGAVEKLFAASPSEAKADLNGCKRVALIPLDNYSGVPNGGDIVTGILLTNLVAQGFTVIEPGFVRELGLAQGIINRGGVDRASSMALQEAFGVCRVMTGAVERLAVATGVPTESVPSFAVGIRVMSPDDGIVYAMHELERNGDDGEWMFQRGRQHALVPLVNKTLKKYLSNKRNREEFIYGQHVR